MVRQRLLLGIAIVGILAGSFLAFAPFKYHEVPCDAAALSAWTNVKFPEDDGARLRDVLSLCAPTARARLAAAGLVGGVGLGLGLATMVLRASARRP